MALESTKNAVLEATFVQLVDYVPENRAIETFAPSLLSACAVTTPSDLTEMSLDDLRLLAFQKGIPHAKRYFSRAMLVSKLSYEG